MAIEYQKGASALHRLDARTKLLLFVGLTVVAILIIDPLIIGALFLVLYEVGARSVDRRMLNRNLRVLVVIFLTFSAFQVLLTPEIFAVHSLWVSSSWRTSTTCFMKRGKSSNWVHWS